MNFNDAHARPQIKEAPHPNVQRPPPQTELGKPPEPSAAPSNTEGFRVRTYVRTYVCLLFVFVLFVVVVTVVWVVLLFLLFSSR